MKKLLYTFLLGSLLLPITWGQTTQQNVLVINGQVLDDRGRPVSGAYVTASPDNGLRGRVPSASSDSRGLFTIAVYKTDSFTVSASKLADDYPSSFNPLYYPTENSLAHVWVKAGQTAPFATIRFGPRAGKVAGRIIDGETGQVVEDVKITLCRAEIPKYCYRPIAKYPGGRFNITVPAAPFTVQISASGYKDWYGPGRVDQQPVSIEVASGTTEVLNVSLEKQSDRGDDVNPDVLKAPQLLLPANGAEFNHYPRATKLEWSAVSGAVSYTVELELCRPGDVDRKECQDPQLLQIRKNPPLSGIVGTTYEFTFIGAQPGRWRVWAVDAKGRVGLKSTWSNFVYTY